MKPGEEFQPLMDDIFREKVLRARQTPGAKKLMMGLELFAVVEERMRCGIRRQFPDADAGEVERLLRARFARLRQVAEYGIYKPAV